MRRRFRLLAFIVFIALDLANPLSPGMIEFESEEVSEFHVSSTTSRPVRTVASGEGPRTAEPRRRKPESAPRLVRAGRMTSDWLAIRQAHAPAPPPPPASEDH